MSEIDISNILGSIHGNFPSVHIPVYILNTTEQMKENCGITVHKIILNDNSIIFMGYNEYIERIKHEKLHQLHK
jgi:hypothetical protein